MPSPRPLPARNLRRAALLCGLLAMAGCARLPQQVSPAPLRQPQSFQTASSLAGTGAWPGADWVGQFKDPQLVALTAEALANNPDLQGARARIVAAQAQAEAAHGAALPTATALFSANRGYVDQDIKLQTPAGPTQPSSSWSNTGQALLGLTYELDLWGKNRANLASAISQQRAAEAEEQQARLSLTTALASAYNQLAQQCAAREVTAQLLEQRKGLDVLAEKRLSAGLDSEVERTRAGQDADDAANQLAQLDEQILLTRHQLGELLGAGPDRGLGIAIPTLASLPTPPLPENLPLQLLGRRPDIVAARWQVEAAARQIDMAKARFYPDINLSAFAGYASFGLSSLSNSYVKGFGAGPALTLPIFEGGQLRANLKGQAAQYDSAVASYNQTLNTALTEVANQITSIRSADTQLDTQSRSLEASRRTYALMQQRHDAGLVSDGSVLDAQALMLAAQQRSLDLEARRRSLQIALVKALGGGFDAQASGLALR